MLRYVIISVISGMWSVYGSEGPKIWMSRMSRSGLDLRNVSRLSSRLSFPRPCPLPSVYPRLPALTTISSPNSPLCTHLSPRLSPRGAPLLSPFSLFTSAFSHLLLFPHLSPCLSSCLSLHLAQPPISAHLKMTVIPHLAPPARILELMPFHPP
jgi:hypothetical protein